MREMIKRVREEKGGFTLAELLIVVAIVMVLVAIAVPVFAGSMDSANASTDEANIRSGYAQGQVYALTGKTAEGTDVQMGTPYYLTTDAGLSASKDKAYVMKGAGAKVTDVPSYIPNTWVAGQIAIYTFSKDDKGVITQVITYGAK